MAELHKAVSQKHFGRGFVPYANCGLDSVKPEPHKSIIQREPNCLSGVAFAAMVLGYAIAQLRALEVVATDPGKVDAGNKVARPVSREELIRAALCGFGLSSCDRFCDSARLIEGCRPRINVRLEERPVCELELAQVLFVLGRGCR